MRAVVVDVCCSPLARLGGAQTPCKCQQEDETPGLHRSTNTRLRRRESSPSFLMCWFHGARDAGSQVSLVSLPRLDSRLKAAGPFVFFGIVCLYVKCLCVLISLRITCLACPKFQSQSVSFAVITVGIFCSPPASLQSFPLGSSLETIVEIAYYYLAFKNVAS